MRGIPAVAATALVVVSSICWAPVAGAQNTPPKPESDCGVTSMCLRPTPPAHHGVPFWLVELVMLAAVGAVLLLAYRLVLGATDSGRRDRGK